jgi:hypothetical protein
MRIRPENDSDEQIGSLAGNQSPLFWESKSGQTNGQEFGKKIGRRLASGSDGQTIEKRPKWTSVQIGREIPGTPVVRHDPESA